MPLVYAEHAENILLQVRRRLKRKDYKAVQEIFDKITPDTIGQDEYNAFVEGMRNGPTK